MSVFRNTVFCAVVAGLLAGLMLAVLQTFTTVPLIKAAESYEGGVSAPVAAAHEHAPGTAAHEHAVTPAPETGDHASNGDHHHDSDAWAPADGFQRSASTFGVNAVTGIGFALLLIVASELAGGLSSWRQGVLWGLAGFAVFTLAPGLGLPPELPAMPAADIAARQTWWWTTVAATGAGLAMIVFRGSALWSIAGLALIVAPHLFGAPQPVSYDTPVPASLHHDFVVMSTVTNLVFWVILGGLAGLLRNRFFGAEGMVEGKLA